jgi:hypothetical protein
MKSSWLVLLLLPGCYYLGQNTYKDIVDDPSSGWSGPEVLTVIMEAGNHNLLDGRTNIKAIATPYYPSVIKAIGRRAQLLNHWSEAQFRGWVDRLLYEGSGMYVNWESPSEPIYDSKLHHLDSIAQFDSLMVLLTLIDVGYPHPDITQLEEQLFLVNERGDVLSPQTVWGRRMNILTNFDETLFLKFNLWDDTTHFLKNSRRYFLLIKGLDGNIRLELAANLMR